MFSPFLFCSRSSSFACPIEGCSVDSTLSVLSPGVKFSVRLPGESVECLSWRRRRPECPGCKGGMVEDQTRRDVSHCTLAVFAAEEEGDEGPAIRGFQVLVRGMR